MKSRDLPLAQALLWILLSIIVISGIPALSWAYYVHRMDSKKKNSKYLIRQLTQVSASKEVLKNVYLQELLGLAKDRPQNLYAMDLKLAEEALLRSPVISRAHVSREAPSTLRVKYSVRQPVVYLIDYANAALDEEGVVIPFRPFFSPKRLPEVYLGEKDDISWGSHVNPERLVQVWDLMHLVEGQGDGLELQRIDVSKMRDPSLGQRQLVLSVKEGDREWILRLSAKDYKQDFQRFITLKESVDSQEHQDLSCIDFRIPNLAFISENDL